MLIFLRVVDHGGFAPASKASGLSPSAVSKLVTRLEERLGARLLRRSTRRVMLTPEGERFYARALAILAEIDAAEREAGGAGRAAGRIRVNSSASYVAHRLAMLLPVFLDRYPEIEIDVIQTDEIADLFREPSDVAIRAGPLSDSSLIARSLGATPLIAVAAPAWLAKQSTPVTLDKVMRGDRIGFAYPRLMGGWLDGRLDTPERVRVSDGEGVRRLALAGVGVARIAEFTIRSELARGELVPVLGLELPPAMEPFHAVYVGRSDRLPARARVLLDFLAEHGRVDKAPRPPDMPT